MLARRRKPTYIELTVPRPSHVPMPDIDALRKSHDDITALSERALELAGNHDRYAEPARAIVGALQPHLLQDAQAREALEEPAMQEGGYGRLAYAAAVGLAIADAEQEAFAPPAGAVDARAYTALAYAGVGHRHWLMGYFTFAGYWIGRTGTAGADALTAAARPRAQPPAPTTVPTEAPRVLFNEALLRWECEAHAAAECSICPGAADLCRARNVADRPPG
jgi:hypothetical protein